MEKENQMLLVLKVDKSLLQEESPEINFDLINYKICPSLKQ